MGEQQPSSGAAAFALIYLTFFLDNVLLTVLVPIIPDWVSASSLALWARGDSPLAALLNGTNPVGIDSSDSGSAQAVVGAVLGAKAAAQLACAPLCAAAVCRCGPARVLRAATALLALAATVFAGCGLVGADGGGATRAWCLGAGRALQGAGAAGAGVAGLALAAAALQPARRDRAVAALLGAVALGVLVGYPFGGAACALWGRATPFLVVAAALLANLGMQHNYLNKEEYNRPYVSPSGALGAGGGVCAAARRGAAGWCAGAVLLTTCVMAALEPCLPLWVARRFHPQRWAAGLVFVPDSAGYLLGTAALGGAARRLGAERVALTGQLAVGLAALAVPHAPSVWWLAAPQGVLGAGLGALDAALVPALLARHASRGHAPALAALLQGASAGAYALGPLLGGLWAARAGFPAALRALGVANLLYAALLYRALRRYPLSPQWGAADEDDEDSGSATDSAELAPLRYGQTHGQYEPLR